MTTRRHDSTGSAAGRLALLAATTLALAALTLAALAVVAASPASAWTSYSASHTPSYYVPVDSWTSTTENDTGRVDEVVRVGATTYLAGNFTKMRSNNGATTVTRSYIGAVDSVTGALKTSFNPTVNGRIHALEASPDGLTVYIGGDFTTVNGVAMDGLAALDASTGAVKSSLLPNPKIGGTVYDLSATASALYVGGNITAVNGSARDNVARYNLASSKLTIDAAWKPKVSGGKVSAMEFDSARSRVVIGGAFTSIGGQATQRYIGAVKTSDGTPVAWTDHPPASDANRIIDLDVTSSGVYAAQGGSNWARAYELATGKERWSFNSDGDNQAIAEYGGKVVVGFHGNVTAPRPGITYQSVAANQRVAHDKIFMLDAATGNLQSWSPSLSAVQDTSSGQWSSPLGVWSLDASGGSLYVGGDFGKVNSKVQSRFAIFPGV